MIAGTLERAPTFDPEKFEATYTRLKDSFAVGELCRDAAFVIADTSGVIRYANAAAEMLTGYARELLEGMTIYQLMPPGTAGRHGTRLAAAFRSSGKPTMQTHQADIVTRDREEVAVQIDLCPAPGSAAGSPIVVYARRQESKKGHCEQDA